MSFFTVPVKPHDSTSKVRTTLLATMNGFFQSKQKLDIEFERHLVLEANLKSATTYSQWLQAAGELDKLEGKEEWKLELESESYNYQIIQIRLKELRDTKLKCDIKKMLFLIRTTFSRNTGDMGNINLYQRSHTGTKRLIEKYIDSCLETIAGIVAAPQSPVTPSNKAILEALVCTRQAYGRTALLLSGGATFGMNHIGVLKALWEGDLLPRIISGASAGSIVASVICTRTDDEIPDVIESFPNGDLDVFDDSTNPESVFQRIGRFLKIGAWIDIKHLIRVMKAMLGDMTFHEAYNRTRRILNICVSSASTYDLPRLLNYISSPNVIIWSAVAASCSVPFVFTSAQLLAKDPRTGNPVPWNPSFQRWIDGSVENDLPMMRLSEMFNVNHFIVSQVNPHVVPFISEPSYTSRSTHSSLSRWGTIAAKLAISEGMHRMAVLAELGLFRTSLTKAKSVLSQDYSGDITILPDISISDLPHTLANPSPDFMLRACLSGERATWPKLSRIRNHCAVELALDKAIYQLRTRVVFSPSRVELRLRVPTNEHPRRRRVKSSDAMYLNGYIPSNHWRSFSGGKIIEVSESATGSPNSSRRSVQFEMRVPEAGIREESSDTEDEADGGGSQKIQRRHILGTLTPPKNINLPSPNWQTQNPFNLFMTPSSTPYNSVPVSPELRRTDSYVESNCYFLNGNSAEIL